MEVGWENTGWETAGRVPLHGIWRSYYYYYYIILLVDSGRIGYRHGKSEFAGQPAGFNSLREEGVVPERNHVDMLRGSS